MRRSFVTAIGVAALALGALAVVALRAAPGGSAAGSPSAGVPSAGSASVGAPTLLTIVGHGQFARSETEFIFTDGAATYDVKMDLSTRCVNLRGKLLGGYQLVSRLLMTTSLPLTITGTFDGRLLLAQTVLVPTTKDALT